MYKSSLARAGVCAVILSAVSGCLGGSSGAAISAETPGYFSGRVTDGTMSGAYNPAGFSSAEVRQLVGRACAGSLTGFSGDTREDGLASFGASCDLWQDDARHVEFQRAQGRNVVIEILGTDGAGTLVQTRIDATL